MRIGALGRGGWTKFVRFEGGTIRRIRSWCFVAGELCGLRGGEVGGLPSSLERGWRLARGNIRLCRSSGRMGGGRLLGRRRRAA
jgi:hypothetical protein